MKTDVIIVKSDLKGKEAAMAATEKFAAYNEIEGKSAIHLRLLTEETISMIHGIFDGFTGKFWLESKKTDKGTLCRICVSVPKIADCEQEMQLISVASDGVNLNAKGFMGKIREIIRFTVQPPPEKLRNNKAKLEDAWWNKGADNKNDSGDKWSLTAYKESLSSEAGSADKDWDELEKSIVAKLADEVKIWLKSDSTEVIIEKIF